MKKYVTYCRVSTQKQDLGLVAQNKIISDYISLNDVIIASYIEKESGRNNNRSELTKAIEFAKNNDAILLIAKLDRLSRNMAFISLLMDSKVKFQAVDIPSADNFTIHIFAALAEREVEMIRERTKNALGVIKNNIKTKGSHITKEGKVITRLGRSEMKEEHRMMGQVAIKEKRENNPNLKKAKAFAESLKASGMNGVAITAMLNLNGFKTSTGKEFHHAQTMRLFK